VQQAKTEEFREMLLQARANISNLEHRIEACEAITRRLADQGIVTTH
jgi:BMFP domain-containing protein YqiC